MDLLPLIPTGASRVHGNSVLTWASSGSGDSGPYLDFTWIWCLWSPPGPLLDLVTLFPTWFFPGFGDSAPQFGLPWTWCLSFPL